MDTAGMSDYFSILSSGQHDDPGDLLAINPTLGHSANAPDTNSLKAADEAQSTDQYRGSFENGYLPATISMSYAHPGGVLPEVSHEDRSISHFNQPNGHHGYQSSPSFSTPYGHGHPVPPSHDPYSHLPGYVQPYPLQMGSASYSMQMSSAYKGHGVLDESWYNSMPQAYQSSDQSSGFQDSDDVAPSGLHASDHLNFSNDQNDYLRDQVHHDLESADHVEHGFPKPTIGDGRINVAEEPASTGVHFANPDFDTAGSISLPQGATGSAGHFAATFASPNMQSTMARHTQMNMRFRAVDSASKAPAPTPINPHAVQMGRINKTNRQNHVRPLPQPVSTAVSTVPSQDVPSLKRRKRSASKRASQAKTNKDCAKWNSKLVKIELKVKRETPPDLNDDGMYFNSHEEASKTMQGLKWPPRLDATLPVRTDQNARRKIVKELFAAINDMTDFRDKAGPVFKNRWYTGLDNEDATATNKAGFYEPWKKEKLCWEILYTTEKLYREGTSFISILDPKVLKEAEKWRYLTFRKRIDMFADLLRLYKSRVDKLMRGNCVEEYVLIVGKLLETSKTNLLNNAVRQVDLVEGRKRQGRRTRRNATPPQAPMPSAAGLDSDADQDAGGYDTPVFANNAPAITLTQPVKRKRSGTENDIADGPSSPLKHSRMTNDF